MIESVFIESPTSRVVTCVPDKMKPSTPRILVGNLTLTRLLHPENIDDVILVNFVALLKSTSVRSVILDNAQVPIFDTLASGSTITLLTPETFEKA